MSTRFAAMALSLRSCGWLCLGRRALHGDVRAMHVPKLDRCHARRRSRAKAAANCACCWADGRHGVGCIYFRRHVAASTFGIGARAAAARSVLRMRIAHLAVWLVEPDLGVWRVWLRVPW